MAEYIDRNAVINAISREMDMQDLYLPVHFLDVLNDVPAADVVKVVRCKNCKHRPYSTEPGKTYGLTIKAPDGMCPCYNEDDGWYSWVPDNEFFCSYGERKEG